MMNHSILVLCLANLALIGALPRIFFRRGRLNLQWWLTASPFFACALVLLAALSGTLAPALSPSPLRDSVAALLCAGSILLIGFTLGTHRKPLSLWHQRNDAPRHLVTHGAYARIRHPFYSAFLAALLGCVAAFPHFATLGAFAFALAQLSRTAAGEERALLGSALGGEYRAYLARTGRFLPQLRPTDAAGAGEQKGEARTSSSEKDYVPVRM